MRAPRRVLVGLACVVLALVSPSPPASGASRIVEATLENGLTVLLLEERKAPVVTVQVWYKVGSRNEVPGTTGVSHLLEHMMFKGAPSEAPGTFSRIVQKNGGRDNAFTSDDYTAYFENLASDRLLLALRLEADRMRSLRVDPADVAAEKKVIMEERRLRVDDDPISATGEELLAVAFKAHPYRHPIIGWASDIEGLTAEDVRRHYSTYYVPNNATLIVVGDFNAQDLLPVIRGLFESIPRGPEPPAVRVREPEQRGERRVVVRREAELPFVFIGYHAPSLTDPDSFALEVLETLLAEGKSSRLHQHLVYDKQLALFAGGSYSRVSRDPHLLYVYASVMPGKGVDEVGAALLREIERLKREVPEERELQKAKNVLEAQFLLSQDSIFSLGRQLGAYWSVAHWTVWEQYVEGIRAVTGEDVRRVAGRYLRTENQTVAILLPEKEK